MKKLENKLSSREVADMMEVKHTNLLQKIEGINRDFENSKISFQKYWSESFYKIVGNNKTYREFMITKRGCEFLAHKTTGTKGNLFTDRYMDKFAEMEQFIEEGSKKQLSPMEILELQFGIVKQQGEKIETIENKVETLAGTMTIDHGQACNVKSAVDSAVKKLCCGNESAAYENKSIRAKVYRFIWGSIKEYFNVTAYHNLLRKDVDKAINYVSNLKLQGKLLREVQEVNNQMCFQEVI
ncbi:MAG: ORF6C domain-containing protein [Clostridium sp.]